MTYYEITGSLFVQIPKPLKTQALFQALKHPKPVTPKTITALYTILKTLVPVHKP